MTQSLSEKLLQARENALLTHRREDAESASPFSLEIAGYVQGVRVLNDSAATTPKRLADSLASFDEPVVWIAEANVFLSDLSPLQDLIAEKVKITIAVGPQADKLHEQLWPALKLFMSAHSWEEAIDLALMASKANDSLLFSPGCRADEPFANLRERGSFFNRLIDIKRNTLKPMP